MESQRTDTEKIILIEESKEKALWNYQTKCIVQNKCKKIQKT